ncbi:MAG: phospholipase A [Tannerella sp.]|nr:phospholipase A [Tannerella sp.]
MKERREIVMDRIEELTPKYNADSVRAEIEKGPYFSLYKDNYFIGGTEIGEGINGMTAANSNIKFQLSISQRLTRSRLPFDTYLYIQFTQKTIWNVLEESLPMYDMNFNPGIGLGHLIIRQNKYIGNAYLMLEHESNGKDGEYSRSWNKVSFGWRLMLSKYVDTHVKAWVPIVDSDNNRDILRYNGLAEVSFNYISPGKRFIFTLASTWRSRSFSFNTQWELSFKTNKNVNQYLFIQYYNGYGECLLDYNRYKNMLRIGFVIKPQGFNLFHALP